jgi:MinD superfamily P-loop ATPase
MSFKIAIASGKGGTGKTTVSVNLYHFIKKYWTPSVQLIDCDVEEPNDAIFFKNLTAGDASHINQQIPFIDSNHCSFCRKCVEYCEFNAIVVIPPVKFAEVNPDLCHSCGACAYICPEHNAIEEKPHAIGKIQAYCSSANNELIEGRLHIGSAMQTMVIKELIKSPLLNADVQLFDAPPGTSCPVVATVTNADYILLVAEASPFGLHDLKLMVALLREVNRDFAVIINKAADDYLEMENYLKKEQIEVLGRISYSQDYARQYAQGSLNENIPPQMETTYQNVISNIQKKALQHA